MDNQLNRGRWIPDSEGEEDFLRMLEEAPRDVPGRVRQRKPQAFSEGLLARIVGGLAPWQRFVLALLLFLNVALLGCMCLVMTGRVVPFSP